MTGAGWNFEELGTTTDIRTFPSLPPLPPEGRRPVA